MAESNTKQAMRAKRVSFKKRKSCIMKKAMELSVLCDASVCAVVVDTNGEVETWPENKSEVLKIINRYKDWQGVQVDQKKALPLNDDPVLELDDSLFEGLSMESLEDLLKDCVGDDNDQNPVLNDCLLDGMPIESLQDLLTEVDLKLEAVAKRIHFVNEQQNTNGNQLLVLNEEAFLMQKIQTPLFFKDGVPEQSLFDMVPTTSCFFTDAPEQSILDMVTNQFSGYNSKQSIFNMVPGGPALSFFGEFPEQYDPQLNSTTSYFFTDAPGQRILDMVTNPFSGYNSEQSIFDMVPGGPTQSFFGEFPEQYNPQLNSTLNSDYGFSFST